MSLNTPAALCPRVAHVSAADDAVRYRALVEQMVDGLFVSDAAGRYIDVNPAGCEMLGYSREELLRMSIPDVVSGEEIPRVRPEVERLAGGGLVRSEWRFRRKDGSVFIGEVMGRQLADGRLQAILRDVSSDRATENRLRQAEQRHRIALAAAELGTWCFEVEDGVVRLDAEARVMLCVPSECVPVRDILARLHPDDAAGAKAVVAAALDPDRPGAAVAKDFRVMLEDGSVRWLRGHAHIEFAGGGGGRRPVQVIGTLEDITARSVAHAWLTRLSRAYETRSEINKCVVRAIDEHELLTDACRIAADYAGFRLVRAVPFDGTGGFAGPAIHYGPASRLAECNGMLQWLDAAPVREGLREALLRRGHHVSAALEEDRFLACQHAACTEAGIASACILPLLVESRLVGAMAFYAADADCFDDDMVRLLDEMAADISFGLESLAEARRMHESETHFSTIFRTSPDCILIVRLSDDRVTDANDGFLRAFGYRREEVVGATVPDLALWESAAACASMLAMLEESGRIRDLEARWRHRSGELRDCIVSGEIVELGGARHLSCVVRDVTERRAIDRLLYAREQEFRALAENSPDIISRFDSEGRRVYSNRELTRCFGVSLSEVIGKTPTEGMPGQAVAQEIQAAVTRVLATAQEADIDVAGPEAASGGTVHRHVRMVPEFDAAGRVVSVLAIGRDVTRLKETKERLRETQQQLRALDARREHAREDERKRMAREIHDVLGQMLTALRLDLDMLGMEFGGEQPLLLERTGKATRLVDDTIGVVRNLATALRPPVLDMGIVSALEWLAREFAGHSGIACEVAAHEGDLVAFSEDAATNVFRIVQESLTNVARHARARRIVVSLVRADGGYELSISDDGKGFDPAGLENRSLGLVGMRERAVGLGGTLDIRSIGGGGTRIVVRFPAPGKGDES